MRSPLRRLGQVLAPRPVPDASGELGADDPSPVEPRTPLDAYDDLRRTPHRASPCNAPATNLYFSATGNVGPCWIQLGELGEAWSSQRSIRDIWTGEAFTRLRSELAERRFPGACARCEHDIDCGVAPLAAIYDHDRPILDVPTSLELELSNLCNFECVMCNGDLSSKIRRNREHLPPLHVPYDDSFVEQVAELVPTLQHVRFSGGEPLLHPILYEICERIIELRPELRIVISTNGSTLTPKVRSLLARAQVQINISFESLRPERYEAIRVGSDHARLLANIEEFRELVAPNGGLVTINANPMRDTWDEMADIVRYCDERDLYLSFNTVIHPAELSLRTLPAATLADIVVHLEAESWAAVDTSAAPWNHDQFDNLVEQVRTWQAEAADREVPVAIGARPTTA